MTERTDNSNSSTLDDRYLERISALLDGEIDGEVDGHLDRESLLQTIDFLVRSEEGRAFYRESRELDGLLEAGGQRSATPHQRLDARVWSGIKERVESQSSNQTARVVALEDRKGRQREDDSESKSHPVWILAAAIFAAVLGLASYELWQDRSSGTPDAGVQVASLDQEVEVGSSPDSMNDERFFDLATELLEADRKYRKEMLALMTAVEDEPLVEKSTEESSEDLFLRGGEGDFGEADSDERGRVEVNFW